MEVEVFNPPPHVFAQRTKSKVEQVILPTTTVPIFEGLQFAPQGHMQLKYRSIPFLRKGFPYPQALASVNSVKRLTMLFTALSAIRHPFKALELVLYHYNRICDWELASHYLHWRYCTPTARELWMFLYLLLRNLRVTEHIAYSSARIFATLVEYDDAYRYRAQDLLSETTKEKLIQDPRGEIKRLLQIFSDREPNITHDVGSRFLSIGKILSVLLLIPKIRTAFTKALTDTKFESLQLDEDDRYWCLMRPDYKFFGHTFQQRISKWEAIHEKNGFPPLINVSLQ